MEWREKTRPVSPDWAVIDSIDDTDGKTSEDGDDEIMDIDLSKVSPDVQEIIITVSIYQYQERRQNFGQVERAYVRLYKPGNDAEGREDYRYDLTEDFSTCASVEFCRLYRRNGEWKVQALGIGHKGGLEELVSKFT
jgi:tellurium resistance protein TerD